MEFWMDIYALLYLKWITNKDLLYSTWNSNQCYYVAAWRWGDYGGEWLYVYVWLSPFIFHLKLSQHCLLNNYCCCSVTKSCLTLCDPTDYWANDAIQSSILCHPSLLLPSVFSSIRVFSTGSALHIRWPKYWSFSISLSNEYSGLISFSIDWFDLAVQGALKNLLQHHNLKASIFQCSALFMVQLSHPSMATGKIIALTIWTIVNTPLWNKKFFKKSLPGNHLQGRQRCGGNIKMLWSFKENTIMLISPLKHI